MKRLVLSLVLAASATALQAESGWVLYAPPAASEETGTPTVSGGDYVTDLLGSYENHPMHTSESLSEAQKAEMCAQHLRNVVQAISYPLSGYSYSLSLEIEGADGALKGVRCRVNTSRDTSFVIEVEDK